MSYQIKSTPYFRRMYNNSKRNGQLQRLREEYERIQEFNDRTIELKMRQVRLKRLFREIEEIKEGPGSAPMPGAGSLVSGLATCSAGTSTATSRAMQRRRRQELVAPTLEQQQYLQRLDTLARAKELGKEISRRNAELAEAGVGHSLRSDLRLTTKMQAAVNAKRAAADRRERAAKRISYGNAQSKQNLQRIVSSRQRRLCGGGFTGTGAAAAAAAGSLDYCCSSGSSGQQAPVAAINMSRLQRPDLTKKAMLKQRLSYGNSRSCSNMRRQVRHKVALGQSHSHAHGQRQGQLDLLADTEEEGDDDDDEEQQRLELHSESSGHRLHLDHYTPSSRTTATATTAVEDQEEPPATLFDEQDDSEPEMCTAPGASTSQAQPPTAQSCSQCPKHGPNPPQNVAITQVDAVSSPQDSNNNNWHRISLTLPWFKAFPRFLDGTLPVCATESISSSSSYEDLLDPTPTTTTNGSESHFQPQQQGFLLPPFRFRKTNN